MSVDPFEAPRAAGGRAPDVFRPGAWVPMRQYRDSDAIDFVIVGTGAGGGTLACKLAEVRIFRSRNGCRALFPSIGRFRV